ncbi:MAG: hypothetical protein HYZ42_10345 [Bacteroidetes bacterium]|nr:hypothetical protein [Bacteroidota bacterium]
MIRKTIVFLLILSSSYIQAQTMSEGKAKLNEAKELEQRLYPTFTQEILTKTMDAYHKAGEIFHTIMTTKTEEKVTASYYNLYAWLQEAELLEAMNRHRAICDLYVNTFDHFIPALKVKEYKQTEINQIQYDTTYIKTLWLLFYNTQECHKDLFTVKYGMILKNYITKDNKLMPDVYITTIQSNVNIDLFKEAYDEFVDFTVKCKGIKLSTDQKAALKKALFELKSKSGDALTSPQIKEIEKHLN